MSKVQLTKGTKMFPEQTVETEGINHEDWAGI